MPKIYYHIFINIEKCSSPTGDGNRCDHPAAAASLLRNAVPRQGTETHFHLLYLISKIIEKCSSPTGDGNHMEGVNNNTSYH